MADRAIIRKGDPTSHGGVVLEGHATQTSYGRAIAGLGHMTHCPQCNGRFPIAEGVLTHSIYGIPTAVEGMKTACGATLIATQHRDTIDTGSDNGLPPSATVARTAAHAAAALADMASPRHAYDEQIQFLLASGAALAGVAYTLTLDDGSQVAGTTDAEGKTGRVRTAEPCVISSATLQPDRVFCCAKQAENAADSSEDCIEVKLEGVQTNANNVGSSITEHKLEGDARLLTAGEIELAKKIFGDSVDYTKVKIHNGAYMIGAGNNAMTPNGEMYFPTRNYFHDFSIVNDYLKIWFIHEMTHVWQYQLGYNMKWAGILIKFKGGYSYNPGQEMPRAYIYNPTTDINKSMADFNMEQQGDLVSHYFAATFLAEDTMEHMKHSVNLNFFRKVLAEFLTNPSNNSLLPNSTRVDN